MPAVNDDAVIIMAHFAGVSAEDGVILEEIGKQIRRLMVIDGREIEASQLHACADRKPPDPAEAVDADVDVHSLPPKTML